jgi:hypothetical protein
MEATMTDRPVIKLFNGRYTIQSKQTGEHRTFWVKTQAADAKFAPGRRVVSLLTGSQNDDPATRRSDSSRTPGSGSSPRSSWRAALPA